ncbi:cytidylate kinase-like family protein [Magnetospirillum sulfuroxidans]|uniref:Cytidylate kinase-like family protein n=1 Tax=Magnetospirillum sulfuroxidans TaxID=611300 RepID=A0ABS5IFT2_9PROT|nr:cytidylate kinase-like family protein [Magnetospirillum sulfuroxidans]MBR9973277.1 cytidylate kinase-like family protein [Magnetospirillum sulfuroxidans]
MSHNILSVIAAMAEVANVTHDDPTTRHPKKPVITISRDYGSGGDVIAHRLSQRLEIPLYDEEVLKEIAMRLQDDPAVVRMLDEGFGRAKDMWLYRLFSGNDVGPDVYRDTLVKVVMSLGRMGGVLVGRGAHVILHEACALRVRITGTPEICARRMIGQGYGGLEHQLEKVLEINHKRGKFVWEVFNSRLSDASQFDININTDRMADFEDVVGMLEVMARAIHAGRVLGL